MADLSRESRLPVATIKFYLREGLLPPGERTSPNQARYTTEHVRRLRLIRALIDAGGFSVAQVREVLQAMEDGPMAALATAQRAMVGAYESPGKGDDWADQRFTELIEDLGWRVDPDSHAAHHLRGILASARDAADMDLVRDWAYYVERVDAIARDDVDRIATQPDVEGVVAGAVAGTVLGAAYLNALRLLGHQHYSASRSFDTSEGM